MNEIEIDTLEQFTGLNGRVLTGLNRRRPRGHLVIPIVIRTLNVDDVYVGTEYLIAEETDDGNG